MSKRVLCTELDKAQQASVKSALKQRGVAVDIVSLTAKKSVLQRVAVENYYAVIIADYGSSNKRFEVSDVVSMHDNFPNLRIIYLLQSKTDYSVEELKRLIESGVYDILFRSDANLNAISGLIAVGRNRTSALDYIGVDSVAVERVLIDAQVMAGLNHYIKSGVDTLDMVERFHQKMSIYDEEHQRYYCQTLSDAVILGAVTTDALYRKYVPVVEPPKRKNVFARMFSRSKPAETKVPVQFGDTLVSRDSALWEMEQSTVEVNALTGKLTSNGVKAETVASIISTQDTVQTPGAGEKVNITGLSVSDMESELSVVKEATAGATVKPGVEAQHAVNPVERATETMTQVHDVSVISPELLTKQQSLSSSNPVQSVPQETTPAGPSMLQPEPDVVHPEAADTVITSEECAKLPLDGEYDAGQPVKPEKENIREEKGANETPSKVFVAPGNVISIQLVGDSQGVADTSGVPEKVTGTGEISGHMENTEKHTEPRMNYKQYAEMRRQREEKKLEEERLKIEEEKRIEEERQREAEETRKKEEQTRMAEELRKAEEARLEAQRIEEERKAEEQRRLKAQLEEERRVLEEERQRQERELAERKQRFEEETASARKKAEEEVERLRQNALAEQQEFEKEQAMAKLRAEEERKVQEQQFEERQNRLDEDVRVMRENARREAEQLHAELEEERRRFELERSEQSARLEEKYQEQERQLQERQLQFDAEKAELLRERDSVGQDRQAIAEKERQLEEERLQIEDERRILRKNAEIEAEKLRKSLEMERKAFEDEYENKRLAMADERQAGEQDFARRQLQLEEEKRRFAESAEQREREFEEKQRSAERILHERMHQFETERAEFEQAVALERARLEEERKELRENTRKAQLAALDELAVRQREIERAEKAHAERELSIQREQKRLEEERRALAYEKKLQKKEQQHADKRTKIVGVVAKNDADFLDLDEPVVINKTNTGKGREVSVDKKKTRAVPVYPICLGGGLVVFAVLVVLILGKGLSGKQALSYAGFASVENREATYDTRQVAVADTGGSSASVSSSELTQDISSENTSESASSTDRTTEKRTDRTTERRTETTTEGKTERTTEATTEATTAAPTTEAPTTEEPTTEAPPKPSGLETYDGCVCTGSEVLAVIGKFGSSYGIIVETRNHGVLSFGTYGSDNISLIDTSASYYATVTYVNGSAAAIRFVQG